MTIQELHYDFKLKQNRIDSLSNLDFNAAEIDWLLNEAQIIFIKQRFESTPNRKGFEQSQKRIDDLSNLVIKFPIQPPIVPIHHGSNIYEVDLSTLEYKYLFFIGGSALGTTNSCNKNILLKFVQHDDFRETIRDPFNNASSEFIPYNFGKASNKDTASIYIYSGDIPLSTVSPEYIKYPSRVSFGTYAYIDGTTYPQTTFQTSEHTHTEIVDIAVQLASISTQNSEFVQLSSQKILINE